MCPPDSGDFQLFFEPEIVSKSNAFHENPRKALEFSQKIWHKQTMKITLGEGLVDIDIFCSKNKSDIVSMGTESCLRN